MRTPVLRSSVLVCAAMLSGCGTDDVGDTDIAASETGGDGDGDGDADWEPILARGDIALTQVVVNQGVDVPIASDGVWIGPADRNTFVVASRDTLLRGFWDIPDDWVPRPITAVLELSYPDGTSNTLTDTKLIDKASFAGDLERGFVFALLAEQFAPGVEYHMTLWETGPGAEDQRESTTIIESPIGGLQLIGAQPEPAELKVVVMPVVYNDGNGCSTNTATEITPEQEKLFVDYLHEQYPVQEVLLEFRRETPIQWNQELTSLAQLWQPLQDQRVAENASPNVYFFALVNACTGGIGGAGGIAAGIPPDTKDVAYQRVASGLWIEGDDNFGYETFVHELGHLHGRAHVFCAAGDAAGVDPAYPYEDGIIGVWGFGIRLFKLHSPTATRDFMTYCNPTWVSDWGWSKAFNRIRTLTAWDYAGDGGESEPAREVMIGLVFEDGSEQWWRTPGARAPQEFSSGEFIDFDYVDDDGRTVSLRSPTAVRILDDGTTMITAMVPRANVAFESATRISADLQVLEIEL